MPLEGLERERERERENANRPGKMLGREREREKDAAGYISSSHYRRLQREREKGVELLYTTYGYVLGYSETFHFMHISYIHLFYLK